MSDMDHSDQQHRSEGRLRPLGAVQWASTIVLGLVWVLVWGRYDLPTLLMGLVFGIVVSVVFPLPPVRFSGTVRPIWWLALAARLVFDLITASVAVAWAALVRGPRVRNAIIRVPLRTRSDFVMTQVAELATLVPGSVALETRRAIRESDLASDESDAGDGGEAGDEPPAREAADRNPVRRTRLLRRPADDPDIVGTNVLYVHVMDLGDAPDLDAQRRKIRALEGRVIRAFGPRAEYEALRRGES